MKSILVVLSVLFLSTEIFSQQSIDAKVEDLFNAGKYSEIISLKDSIVNSNVSDDTYYKLAISFYDSKNYREALKYFNTVIGKDSSVNGSYLYASKSLDNLGEQDAAMKMIEAGLRFNVDKPLFYCQKAELLTKQKNYKEAEELFLKAIKTDSKNPRAYTKLSILYFNNNKVDDAVKILEEGKSKADKEDWEYPVMLATLGEVYSRTEKYGKSNDNYIELLGYWKDDPEVLSQIVQNYFALSLYDFAKKYQGELYRLYSEKKIPKEMNDEFCFNIFEWDEGICEAYEKFESPPNDGSTLRFHKHVYYFYGKEGKLKFSIQTELFASFGEKLKFDYVLGRSETKDGMYYHSTYTTLNYALPMDYKKLKEDVFKVLYNKINPVTSSSTKIKE